MKLRRQKRRTSKALDGIASVTAIWSDRQLGKRAGKGVKKVKALRPPGKVKGILSSRLVRIGGAVAVVGGAGGAIFKKLRGKPDPATEYTGPAPSVAVEAAATAPQAVQSPLVVAPEPSGEDAKEPAASAAALREVDADTSATTTPEHTEGAAAPHDTGDDDRAAAVAQDAGSEDDGADAEATDAEPAAEVAASPDGGDD